MVYFHGRTVSFRESVTIFSILSQLDEGKKDQKTSSVWIANVGDAHRNGSAWNSKQPVF